MTSRAYATAVLVLGTLAHAPSARAQSNSGALDLLFPIGARATSLGSAYASEQGSEAIWWNPAGIARLTKPEFALDHFASFQVESGDAVSLILPAGRVGTYGISARLFNYGTTPNTTPQGEDVGFSTYRSYVLGGSFAAGFGKLLDGGISFRLYNLSLPCAGLCGEAVSGSFSTATVDVGTQYRPSETSPLRFGVLLSNIGFNLQVRDGPQADALPARVHAAVSFRPTSPSWDPAIKVSLIAEALATPARSSKELRLGGEIGYKQGETSLFARAGYPFLETASEGTGPTFGIGVSNKRVQLDIARVVETFSSNLGKPPTYISIRVGL